MFLYSFSLRIGHKKLKFLSVTAFCFLFGFSATAQAAADGIPVKTLFIQLVNFLPFALLLMYFLRKPLRLFFSKRSEDFLEMESRAEKYELEKQKEYNLEEQKLKDIRLKQRNVARRALQEGEKYKEKKQRELKALQSRLQREKNVFIKLEEAQAQSQLLGQLKQGITHSAQETLKKESLEKSFHENLQKDFLRRAYEFQEELKFTPARFLRLAENKQAVLDQLKELIKAFRGARSPHPLLPFDFL